MVEWAEEAVDAKIQLEFVGVLQADAGNRHGAAGFGEGL